MSYDVDIGGESFNYTYNVSAIFYDHIPADKSRGGLHEIDGLSGKQAGAVLKAAFDRINGSLINNWDAAAVGEPKFCALYDSANGWGSAMGALVFLSRVMAACYSNPRSKVRIS